MAAITICRGLRKLEFDSAHLTPEDRAEARVEFAVDDLLPPGESVHIPLGMRNGKLRALIGVPSLLEEQRAKSPAHEYLYRITGPISEYPPDGK
jgi:hypothetical protein